MDEVLFVRGFDTVDELPNDRQGILEGYKATQVLTLDTLHDQIVRAKKYWIKRRIEHIVIVGCGQSDYKL